VKFSFLQSEESLFDNEKSLSESQTSISAKSEEFYSPKEETEGTCDISPRTSSLDKKRFILTYFRTKQTNIVEKSVALPREARLDNH